MRKAFADRRKRIEDVRRLQEAQSAVASFPNTLEKVPHGLPGELYISLTSYPARYPTLALTIRGLLDQTVAPDKIILWIAEGETDALPGDVRDLCGDRFEIRTCRDLRSYNKLIPMLEAFPDAYCVTADDDIYYPPEWLGHLIRAFDVDDPAIISQRGHMAIIAADKLLPYRRWEMATSALGDDGENRRYCPTGVGGALYPPHAFHAEVLNVELLQALCPTADDLWFFWMAERQGTPQRRTPEWFYVVTWPSTQEVGLWNENVANDRNDAQTLKLENHFGPITNYKAAR